MQHIRSRSRPLRSLNLYLRAARLFLFLSLPSLLFFLPSSVFPEGNNGVYREPTTAVALYPLRRLTSPLFARKEWRMNYYACSNIGVREVREGDASRERERESKYTRCGPIWLFESNAPARVQWANIGIAFDLFSCFVCIWFPVIFIAAGFFFVNK